MAFPPAPTSITCPFCRAPVTVPLRQIVDVSEDPNLKNALLAGRLNAFRCPACGNAGALATPFFYHDPDKELAFIFLPLQVGLKEADQQRLIGTLTNAVMSKLPPEKRKGYLLQPKQFFNLQSLTEAIMAADGVTPEMLAQQQARVTLLQSMADMPVDQLPAFIQEHDAEIDEDLVDLLAAALNASQPGNASPEYAQLTAMYNHILEHSTAGRKLKGTQDVVGAFVANPSRETLLEQLIQAPDVQTREILVSLGRPMLDYSFFQALTARIEAATAAGDAAQTEHLIALRKDIQAIREKADAAARAVIDKRVALMEEMINSDEPDKLARKHVGELDDIFFNVLETGLANAEQNGQQQSLERLQAIGEVAMRAVQATQPPEVRFINALLAADYPDGTARVLQANKKVLSPEFLNWMRRVVDDLRQHEQTESAAKLEQIIRQAAEMIGQGIAIAKS